MTRFQDRTAPDGPTSDSDARVAALFAAWQSGQSMPLWPASQRPATMAQAYAIQRGVIARLAPRPAGWKLGCTSETMQRKLGSDGPISGYALADRIYDSGAQITGARPDMRCVEAEFAFRMATDLPPRAQPYGREEVCAAIATLHPAIEQVESRFTDWQEQSIHDIVADNATHGRLVLGPAVQGWQNMDLDTCPIRLSADGVLLAEGVGGNVLGNPLNAMVWLANHASRWGVGLRQGEVVTTGTCTGLTFVPAQQQISVELADRSAVHTCFVQ